MKDFTSHWQFYVIPDLKTWSTHAAFQTPLEHFANPADAFARFKELRAAPPITMNLRISIQTANLTPA